MMKGHEYSFAGGFPSPETVQKAYDSSDMIRAISCYKHFFPAVSGMAILDGSTAVGLVPNRVFGTMDTGPAQSGLTLNSDTPYGPIILDLSAGPLFVDIPAGPILGAILNADQSWVADVGIPGSDHGEGGRYLLLPPGAEDVDARGAVVLRPTTRHVIVGLRAVPLGGDVAQATSLIKRMRVSPHDPGAAWDEPEWIELSDRPQDTTPNLVQGTLDFWKSLLRYISDEGTTPADRAHLSDLAVLGIRAGEPLPDDGRTVSILERAAVEADAQMRVQSLADRRVERVAWADRRWEWVTLRPENADFQINGLLDATAREIWFYQAIASSPAMFRRKPGGGSAYWFGARDGSGAYLDGGNSYSLTVPLPVPANLFWSITVYDARTRSQIATEQGKAALRSLFELRDDLDGGEVTLHFGPTAPEGAAGRWIQTIPGAGWFVYFRIYGPTEAAFDGSWKPGDFAVESSGG